MPKESGGVSDLSLKLSYWYVRHKPQLRQVLVAVLVVFNVALFGYSGYRLYEILFVWQASHRQLVASVGVDYVNYPAFRQAQAAQPLQITDVAVSGGAGGRYDFTIGLQNANDNFVVRQVRVQFSSGGQPVAEAEGFIYPGETKYLMALGQEFTGQPASIVAQVAEVHWLRVHDFAAQAAPRLQLSTANVVFTPASDSTLSGDLPISRLNFDLSNSSAYSFWGVDIAIVLRSGGQIAGANFLSLTQVLAGQTRMVEVRWAEPLPPISGIEVLPSVDILDPAAYIWPER